jgi:ferredoxin
MKPEYHFRFPDHDAFADMLIDLAEFAKPVLSISDAIIGMEGNGPTQGSPREIGVLLASKSPYNLDLVAAEIIGLKAKDVPTLMAAARRGLSPENADEVEILSDTPLPKQAGFAHVAVRRSLSFSGNRGFFGRTFSFVARKALSSRPTVRRGCIGCQKCAEICPAKAIVMKNKKPVIDRTSCIRCFCCQEFCPVGAMQVHRTAIARLLTRSK